MLDSLDFVVTAVTSALAGAGVLWIVQRLPIRRRYAKTTDEPVKDGSHEHHFDTMRKDGYWRCGESGCGALAPRHKQPKHKGAGVGGGIEP